MYATRIFLVMLSLLPMASKVEAGVWDNLRGMIWKTKAKTAPMIDILIINDKPSVMIEVKGNYQVYDPYSKQYIGKRYMGKKRLMQAEPAGLKWGEEFPGIYQLQIVPEDLSVVTVVDGVAYKGSLFIYDIGGTLSVVNRAPIEDYLSSTLPQQYRDPMPEEVFASIAITGRTNAYYLSQNPKNIYWSVDAMQVGYKGLDSLYPTSDMEHAIQSTRHMVLSKTGSYEGVVTSFPAQWKGVTGDRFTPQAGGASKITLVDAENMATNGQHAAQILSKAFPGSHIELIY